MPKKEMLAHTRARLRAARKLGELHRMGASGLHYGCVRTKRVLEHGIG